MVGLDHLTFSLLFPLFSIDQTFHISSTVAAMVVVISGVIHFFSKLPTVLLPERKKNKEREREREIISVKQCSFCSKHKKQEKNGREMGKSQINKKFHCSEAYKPIKLLQRSP